MSGFSRRKGARGELEVAAILRKRGYPARRGFQARGGKEQPDLVTIPGFHLEVKRVERLNLHAAFRQADDDIPADDDVTIPAVVHRMSREPWLVTLRFEDFLDLLEEADGATAVHQH